MRDLVLNGFMCIIFDLDGHVVVLEGGDSGLRFLGYDKLVERSSKGKTQTPGVGETLWGM